LRDKRAQDGEPAQPFLERSTLLTLTWRVLDHELIRVRVERAGDRVGGRGREQGAAGAQQGGEGGLERGALGGGQGGRYRPAR